MEDKITNHYAKMPKQKVSATFKKHHILPNSMIVVIGGTGSGKTNAVYDMIRRMDGDFFEIIVFNPVSTDEPIYNKLKKEIPDTQLINSIEELPELKSFDEDKDIHKLLIIDDFINLPKKDMKKINEFFTGGRKSGFTVVALCQSYTAVPKIITRNAQYFMIFKVNDNFSIQSILRNHNIHNIKKEIFRELYDDATNEQFSFFTVDLKGGKISHLRKGFLNFYRV
jgi:hypothetical protein